MINSLLITLLFISLVLWTVFAIRKERMFSELYWMIKNQMEKDDEKALEYAQYVIEALKNNQKVLNYSTWILR